MKPWAAEMLKKTYGFTPRRWVAVTYRTVPPYRALMGEPKFVAVRIDSLKIELGDWHGGFVLPSLGEAPDLVDEDRQRFLEATKAADLEKPIPRPRIVCGQVWAGQYTRYTHPSAENLTWEHLITGVVTDEKGRHESSTLDFRGAILVAGLGAPWWGNDVEYDDLGEKP